MAEGQEPASSEALTRGERGVDDRGFGGGAHFPPGKLLDHVRTTQSASCLFDRETGACIALSEAAADLLGVARDQPFTLKLVDVCPPDEVDVPAAADALMRHAGAVRRVRASGEAVTCDVMMQHLAGGGRPCVLVTLIERTVSSRTRALLREREQLFSALVEHAPDIIARIDRELRHVYVNPAVVSATGVAAHQITGGAHPQPGVPLELCVRWAAGVRKVFASGMPYRFEVSFTAPGGEKHYESRMVPELGADAEIESVLAIARDVTDRKRAELALAAAQRELNAGRHAVELLAEALPHPVRIYDGELRHVYANGANSALASVTAGVAGRSNLEAGYEPQLAARWDTELRRVFDTAIAVISNFEHTRSGERTLYESHALPLVDETGRVTRVMWIAFDLGQSDKAANEEAYAAARQRNALVREVHHRVKNNLQGVVGLLRQLANRDDALGPALGKAIVQLQAIAVIHGLQGQDLREHVPLAGMVAEIASSVERATGVVVDYDAAAGDDDAPVCVKESEAVTIALVLNELILNAVKHRREGGRVAISSLVHSKRALIEVSNEGRLAGAFDFDRDTGLGTGLELVKALLPGAGVHLTYTQHGGCVKATFEIAAPLLATASEPPGSQSDWDRRKRPHSDRRR